MEHLEKVRSQFLSLRQLPIAPYGLLLPPMTADRRTTTKRHSALPIYAMTRYLAAHPLHDDRQHPECSQAELL